MQPPGGATVAGEPRVPLLGGGVLAPVLVLLLSSMMRRALAILFCLFALSTSVPPARAQVYISEFVASNGGTLTDEDGDSPDWLELYNAGTAAVNLGGWFLTDDAGLLDKWQFPALTLPPKGFLLVYLSGKDRATAGAPLHANFSLDAAGEYLALVRPNPLTVVSAYSPTYPEQYRDVAYGLVQTVTTNTLLAKGASARYRVPTDDSLGSTWIQPGWSDASWASGPTGLGYETEVPGFAVRNYKANILVDSLTTADGVIANPAQQTSVTGTNEAYLNYFGSGSDGHYGNNAVFPGHQVGADIEDFVIEATATITIPTTGAWTFGVNSDDGFRLTIGSFQISYPSPRGPGDTLGVFNVPTAGDYSLRLVFYERGGGSELELFAAPGSRAAWDSTNFRLVGDTANGGLAVRSVPLAAGGGSLRPLIATDVQAALKDRNPGLYLRSSFAVANPAAVQSLYFRVTYNDGFIAYLNGVEVARRNAPNLAPWNGAATAARPGYLSAEPEVINLSDRLGLLSAGANVLAIHALNRSASDPNFLILPELVEYRVTTLTNAYFPTPTPGAFNVGSVGGFVATPKFSVERGFYDAAFDLELTTATAGATIVYTTNGTLPALTNGFVYQGPVRIGGTTTVRAGAFRSGFEPSLASTHTYLFLDDVIRQSPTGQAPPGWPSSWGANVVDYGMDPDVVNNPTYSGTIRNDLKTLPSFSIVMDLKDLFDPTTGIYANAAQDGRAWERPCSLELIYPDGTPGFQVGAGIRIRGGFSRSTDNPKHAFRFFFRQEYGAPKLEYALFGTNGATSFDNIDLRTFQNYSWSFQNDSRGIFVRDQFNRDVQLAMGHQSERGEFYHLYINGHYWGLFNTCERPEASYGATYYGGNPEDYDVIKVETGPYAILATDGTMDAWARLYQLALAGFASDAAYEFVQGNNPDGTRNAAYENLIDVDNLIDYMLVILYGGNLDAPISNFLGNTSPNNFFAIRNRVGTDGFRFFVHDAEHTLLNVNEDRTGPYPAGDSSINKSNPQWIWQKLQANAEFRLRVADHVHRHFFNNGLLTPIGARAIFQRRTNDIDRAVVGESARWGDAKRTTPFTRVDWLNAVNNVLNNYLPQRSGIVLNQLTTDGLYPTVAAPSFNQHGGYVNAGFNLTLSAPAGTIYYTLDGTDPRLRGGAISPRARAYTGPIVLLESTGVKARVLSGSTWSALNEAAFTLIQTFTDLFITEVMYHPPPTNGFTSEQLEFIELKNVGPNVLDLGGVHFDRGIDFTFPLGTRLAPGAFVVLVSDTNAFTQQYPGVKVDGLYTGRLANGGEALSLVHAIGTPIFAVDYGDSEPWPSAADGGGFSLVPALSDLNPDPNNPVNWRASSTVGGSPGKDDPPVNVPVVLINEILTHTDPPMVDTVELHNPNAFAVDVGNWYLTDRRDVPKKYRIPAPALIAAGGFVKFDEEDYNPTPGVDPSFTLSSHGEEVYLYSADAAGNLTGYSHGFAFGAAANAVTFGRYVTSTGEAHYPPQKAVTLEAPNIGPLVGPVVLNEIRYRPTPGAAEFIELKSVTNAAVQLFDPDFPTNTWKLDGVGFTFPTNIVLAPDGLLLLISGDPATFRARHGVPTNVLVFGPYPGTLQDNGERLQLLRPDHPDLDDNGLPMVPYIEVDEVRYNDQAPWPTEAFTSGASLERRVSDAYGNDPTNWRASPGVPSPGLENTGNRPPQVQAGSNQSHLTDSFPFTVSLQGTAIDDGQPSPPGRVTVAWSQVSGPGAVSFDTPNQLSTTASLPGVGTYALRLTASDGALSASSDVIVVMQRTVGPVTLVASRSAWRYWDKGTLPAANWAATNYDHSSWSNGAAQLGYGDGDEATVVSYGPSSSSKYMTTYFRRSFSVTNAAFVTSLKVGLLRDDGGVVYLNGTEIFRSNLPEGTIGFSTPASTAVSGADENSNFYEKTVDVGLLREGNNVLAVEIHQNNGTSTDLSFDLYLSGTAFPLNTPPQVTAGPDQAVAFPGDVMLDGSSSDDGLPIPPGQLALTWSQVSGPGGITFANRNAGRTRASFSASGNYLLRLAATDGAVTVYDETAVTVTGNAYEQWKAQHFTPAELNDPSISGDAADPDLDGHTNQQEYVAGTNPRDPNSVLRILRAAWDTAAPARLWIYFPAVQAHSYTVEYRGDAAQGGWQKVANLPTQSASGEVAVQDATAGPSPRFYRVVTPAVP